MTTFGAVAALAIFQTQAPTVQLTLHLDGTQVGIAWMTEKITPEGGKKAQTKLQLTAGTQKTTLVEEIEYDPKAYPVRKYIRQTGAGANLMRVATFKGAVATLVEDKGGKRVTKTIAAPANAEIRAESEFWFFTLKPKPGDRNSYYRFDMNRTEWVETDVKYEGTRTILLGGRELQTHCVTIAGLAKTWLDEGGRPIKIEAGKLTMVRD